MDADSALAPPRFKPAHTAAKPRRRHTTIANQSPTERRTTAQCTRLAIAP